MGYLELLAFKLPCRYLVITNDGTRGDEMAKRLRVPDARVKYFMDGADFVTSAEVDTTNLREKLGVSKKTCLLLSVCRLTLWKRLDRIIEAMPEIVRRDENVRLFLIGEGEERRNLELLCDKLGVGDFVVFLGTVTHSHIIEFMRVSDIFVSLYDVTNLTNSTFEAMSCGLCIVALNTGATCRVIKNGVNGVLLDSSDLKKLPDIVGRLLTDDEYRRRLGENGRQYAIKNFKTWEERVATEVDLIEKSFI
jgi:glycosyltransferase involved in cell wall biosynthesis